MQGEISLWRIVRARLWALFVRRPAEYTETHPAASFRRSIFIRHLDAGSCNDSELEIAALANPVYDFERFGFHIVASPRHADILLITGPFTRSMHRAGLAAFHAMPHPRRVITVGDGFEEQSVFAGSYAVMPLPEEIARTRVAHIPGDPPTPREILDALLEVATLW